VKLLSWLAAALLLAGASLSARAVYLHAKAEVAGILIRRAWQQTTQSGDPRPPWPWADTHPVARLQIPRLGYDEIVLADASPRPLAFGPARVASGPDFGEPGNLLLAGHRTSWFRPLRNIRAGDTITLQWFDARQRQLRQRSYIVETIGIVDPQDLELLAPTPDDALTLITCYPFGSSSRSPQRFEVRARPMGESRASR
jgi:sortase A